MVPYTTAEVRAWYLVQTKPRHECTAEDHLAEQDYATYCPRVQRARRRNERWTDAIAPLFPRYLFVGLCHEEQSLAPVRSTPGVCCLVRFGIDYRPVPAALIAELKSHERDGLHQLQLPGRIQPGDAVRVEEGIFCGLTGVFEKVRGADRVLVLLEILGQTTRVELPQGCLAPVAQVALARRG